MKAKPISLSGVPFNEALSDLLKVKPAAKGKDASKKKAKKK